MLFFAGTWSLASLIWGENLRRLRALAVVIALIPALACATGFRNLSLALGAGLPVSTTASALRLGRGSWAWAAPVFAGARAAAMRRIEATLGLLTLAAVVLIFRRRA